MPDDVTSTRPLPPSDSLAEIRGRLRTLTVLVALLALILFLTVAAVFGQLIEYFGFDPMLFGGATMGAAVLGFCIGVWIGRKTA